MPLNDIATDLRPLLGPPDENGNYRYPDGSAIWRTERGKWIAKWADGTMMQGCDEETGMECVWHFESPEDALVPLRDNEEGPFAKITVSESQISAERYRELVRRAISGLKRLGQFTYDRSEYQEPHSLDCSLAGRVSRVFCTGMTRAIELCREFGFDPDYRESDEYKKEDE